MQKENGLWKWMTGVLASVLLTGAAAYLSLGAGALTKTEFRDHLADSKGTEAVVTAKLDKITTEIQSLREQVARLDERLALYTSSSHQKDATP